MTPLFPGLWFLLLALGIAWLARRLEDDLPRRAVLACLVLCCALLAPGLFRGLVLSAPRLDAVPPFGTDPTAAVASLEGDPAVRVLPFERQVRRTLLAGHAPLWNPLHGAGTPLLAAPEAQAGQPFVIAAWLFPPGPALAVTAALQLFVALLFAWLALRRFAPFTAPPGDAAAFAGAAVYALPAVLPVHGWPQAHVAALFPAVLYGLLRLRDPHRRRHRLFAVAATAALLLSGAPRAAGVALAAAAGLFLAHLVRRPPEQRLRPAGRALAALAVAAALAAPVLLPTVRWLPHTESAGDAAAQRFRQLRLDPMGLKALRLHEAGDPRWGGGGTPWEPLGRGGVLLLAALALSRRSTWRRPGHPALETAIPLLLGGASLLAVLAPAPLAGVLCWFHLAPDPTTGSPAFVAVAYTLALLATAGLAALEAPPARRPGISAAAVALLLTAGALLALAGRGDGLVAPAGFAVAAALLVSGRVLRPRAAALLALLALLPVAELLAGALPRPVISSAGFYRPSPLVAALEPVSDLRRTAAVGPTLPPGMTVLYGLSDARAVPGPRPRVYGELLRHLEGPPGFFTAGDDPLYDLLGVGTLLTADGAVVARSTALPRFFLPAATLPFAGGGGPGWRQAVRAAAGAGRETLVQVTPDAESHREPWRATTPDDDRLTAEAATPQRWILRTTLDEERFLASSLYQDGGWHLRLDGRPHPTRLANGPFVGAWLPPGAHRLELVYRPPGLGAGLLVAALGAVGLAWFLRRGGREVA